MANIEKQKNLKSCKIDIPHCISISQRYQLDPFLFRGVPVGELPLPPVIWRKCFDAELRMIDQLLNKTPMQLVTECGFSLESLLEIERSISVFWKNTVKKS